MSPQKQQCIIIPHTLHFKIELITSSVRTQQTTDDEKGIQALLDQS